MEKLSHSAKKSPRGSSIIIKSPEKLSENLDILGKPTEEYSQGRFLSPKRASEKGHEYSPLSQSSDNPPKIAENPLRFSENSGRYERSPEHVLTRTSRVRKFEIPVKPIENFGKLYEVSGKTGESLEVPGKLREISPSASPRNVIITKKLESVKKKEKFAKIWKKFGTV